MARDLSLFRDHRFRLLFSARTCSVLGSAFGPVALSFGVLALPGANAATLSLVVAAESVGMVGFLLFGGVIADRFPRARVMVTADLSAAVAWAALAAMLITGWAPVPVLVGCSALAGMATALFFPASAAVVPDVVAQERLQAANGVLRLGMNAARIAGFAVAGGAVALLGAGWAMSINSAFLVTSAVILSALRLPASGRGESGNVLRDLREGWREFRSRQWLWVVVLQYSFVLLALQAVWGVLGPVVANQRLGGARGWSAVLAAESLGMVIGVIMAIRARPRRPILLVVLLTFPIASLPLALGLHAPLLVAVAAAGAGGLAIDLLTVVWDTTMQREIPEAALSRVSSYDALGSFMFGPIGLMLAGPAVGWLGIDASLLISTGVIIAATCAALCAPDVRRLRAATGPVTVDPGQAGADPAGVAGVPGAGVVETVGPEPAPMPTDPATAAGPVAVPMPTR